MRRAEDPPHHEEIGPELQALLACGVVHVRRPIELVREHVFADLTHAGAELHARTCEGGWPARTAVLASSSAHDRALLADGGELGVLIAHRAAMCGLLGGALAWRFHDRVLTLAATASMVTFEHFGEKHGRLAPELADRSVMVWRDDDGRWRFASRGRPLPCEELDAYGARRIRDRLRIDRLLRYAAALGVPLADARWLQSPGVLLECSKPSPRAGA